MEQARQARQSHMTQPRSSEIDKGVCGRDILQVSPSMSRQQVKSGSDASLCLLLFMFPGTVTLKSICVLQATLDPGIWEGMMEVGHPLPRPFPSVVHGWKEVFI